MSSKIKVDTIENVAGSGNVSLGSGHNLVVPGNITGQGTAAITGNTTVGGTFGVTGASTLTGDTQVTGSLGVGAAPERKFHVEGSGAEFSLVDTSKPTDKKTINMFIDANGKGNIRMMNDAQNSGNAAIVIEGSAPHTAPIVATPYQPSFFFRNTSGSHSAGQVILFNQQYHNNGSHYNAANGRFTAPVAGYYFFFLTVCWDRTTGTGDFYADIRHNGNIAIRVFTDKSGGANSHPQQSAQYGNYMAANDYVDVINQSGAVNVINNGNHCNFGGFKYA